MRIFWLNQQNKRHFALNSRDEQLKTYSLYMNSHSDRLQEYDHLLNKRISNISPRRGKVQTIRIIEEIIKQDHLSQETINEIRQWDDINY